MTKHQRPDDEADGHQTWLADISRADITLDTPRHLFWGPVDPDADDPQDHPDAAEAGEWAEVIPLPAAGSELSGRDGSAEPVEAAAAASAPGTSSDGLDTRSTPRRSRLRRPLLVGAAAALCVLTAVVGTLSAQSKHVALVVDGQTRYVDTRADTVDGVLAAAGLSVSAHDTLAPGGSAGIADGSTIVLDHGQELTVTVDGVQRQVWTTKGRAAAVEEAVAPVQLVQPAVEQAVPALATAYVSIEVGAVRSIGASTTATTVRALLAEHRITLGPLDTVKPGLDTAVRAGQTVTVNRIAVTRSTASVAIPQPADTKVDDDSLDQGTSKVVQAGRSGVQVVTYQVTTRNGIAVAKKELSRTTTRTAQGSVIHVGTRTPDPGSQAAADAAAAKFTYDGNEVLTHDTTFGVNWDGLSMCESTHNPKAVNANPSAGLPTYGLFQFDIPTWESVGGSGNPMDASPSEQLMRAKLLYQQRGLEPWACAYAAQ